jgi:hypothetical protein
MAVEYPLSVIIQTAQLIKAYLSAGDYSDKPCISRGTMTLALALIGRENGKDRNTWTLNPKLFRRRMRAAGFDPATFKVVDERAAGFAWMQLRTTKQFSYKRQIELMASDQEAPGLDIPVIFHQITKEENKLKDIQRSQPKGFTQDKRLNGLFD